MIIAVMIAGLVVIAREFTSPVSLTAEIRKDLQTLEDDGPAPSQPAEENLNAN